jgi:hypothetical protein
LLLLCWCVGVLVCVVGGDIESVPGLGVLQSDKSDEKTCWLRTTSLYPTEVLFRDSVAGIQFERSSAWSTVFSR